MAPSRLRCLQWATCMFSYRSRPIPNKENSASMRWEGKRELSGLPENKKEMLGLILMGFVMGEKYLKRANPWESDFEFESRPILKDTWMSFNNCFWPNRVWKQTNHDSRYSERSGVPATVTVLQHCTVRAHHLQQKVSNRSTLSTGTDPHQLKRSVASTCCLLSSFCLPLVVNACALSLHSQSASWLTLRYSDTHTPSICLFWVLWEKGPYISI